MPDRLLDAFIIGTGSYLPNAPVGNDRIEHVLGSINGVPSRIRRLVLQRNGIESRHYAIDPETRRQTHDNAALTAEALRIAAAAAGVAIERLGALSCGTSSPDQLQPGHALMVHGALKLPPLEVMTASGICCSGVTALKHALLTIRCGDAKLAGASGSELVSNLFHAEHYGAELASRRVGDDDPMIGFEAEFLRWMLSDGAGAVMLADQPRSDGGLSLRVDWIDTWSFAGEFDACMYAGAKKNSDGRLTGWREVDSDTWLRDGYFNLTQDVKLLRKHISEVTIGRALPMVIDRRQLVPESIDWFLPHFSSFYFRPEVTARLQQVGFVIPEERWFTNLATAGNTGSASFFIMLDELLRSGRLKRGQRILGFVPESSRFAVGYLHLTVC